MNVDFKEVVENAVAGFYISNVSGKFIYTNKKFANILGYKDFDDIKSSFIPKDIYYSEEDRKKFLSSLKEKGWLEGFIVKLKKKNGDLIYVALSGKLHEDNETLSGWIIDVTELIEKSKQLALLERLYHENPDAVFICDYNGKILHSNKAFQDLIGEDPNRIKYTKNLFPKNKDVKPIIENIVRIVKKRKIFIGELEVVNKENKIIPCEVKIFALYSKDGKIEYFISIFRDVSKKKELEAQLAHAQKLEIMGKMTSSMIHDMNNIISSLMSYVELLKIFRNESEKFDKYYNKIEKLIESSESIIKRVLRFTKKSQITKTPIRLEELVEDLNNFAEFLTHNKPNIRINIKYRDEDLIILGNKSSLIQILLNLIVNSIDAIEEAKREEGKIIIYFDRVFIKENRYIRIIVEDNGIGIDSHIKEEIFKPFFTTKDYKDKSGTGLGLAIVMQEVERMNGRVDVCSEKGEWTKFIIIFPEHNGREDDYFYEDVFDKITKNKKILIIDDDKFYSESISELLNYYGFKVSYAETGNLGLEMLKKDKFDLLLLDFILPDINPKIILSEIKKKYPELPVYIISGLIEPNVIELQVFKNVKMILAKPITGEELVKKILINI